MGASIVNENNGRDGDATEGTIDSPETLELLETLKQMNDDGLMFTASNTDGQFDHYLAILNGNASMSIETSTAATSISGLLGGTADLSELAEEAGFDEDATAGVGSEELSLNAGAGEFPGLAEPGRYQLGGGAWYMAGTHSQERKAAAWEFMKFVNEADQQVLNHLKGSYLPVRDAVTESAEVQNAWENDAAGQWLKTGYDSFQKLDPNFPGPMIGPYPEVRIILDNLLDEVLLADTDPAQALADAESKITDELAEYADENF